jgi:hypothetical protein
MTKQKPDVKRKQEPRTVPISQMQADGIAQRQNAVAQAQAAADHYMTAILAAHDIAAIAEVALALQPEPHLVVTLPEEKA